MKKLIVDRIEENIAVCETEGEATVNIELCFLPEGVKEGSILLETNGVYELLAEEESKRREELFNLQNSLFDE